MKTDTSRLSFDELKHYLGVFLQMGRVQLDSDWNEQSEIWLRLLQRHAGDTARTGSPNHGFRVDDRILLDAMDSRSGWTTESDPGDTAPLLFVDYFNHRTGDGALTVEGAVALARTVSMDLAGLNEVVLAVKGGFAEAELAFFLGSAGRRQDIPLHADPGLVEGWRIFRGDSSGIPANFDLSAINEYGFRRLNKASRYTFDFIKVDQPIRTLIVPTGHVQAFQATGPNPMDVPRLSINDDRRIWRSTVLQASGAASILYQFPMPRDLSHARKLLQAVQADTAGVSFGLRLFDSGGNEATIAPMSIALTDDWEEFTFDVPAGVDAKQIVAIQWEALNGESQYLFSPLLVEMSLEGNLVIMGGDGTSPRAGRFYGDGLAALKEHHETYFSQPDLPVADPAPLQPPASGSCRVDLAYLDLWERPITYIEDAGIREVALEGPDTCTRTRLVGQVRILMGTPADAAEGAEPPLAEFDRLPKCGSGTLTTKDKPDAVFDPCADPCEPEVAGPFLGEENRLYRVEIHQCGEIGENGAPGTARFKWSRENAAVACPLIVTAEDGAFSIKVEQPELFREGDLIEISDDRVDLITGPFADTTNHRCHERGQLRRVTAINLAEQRVSWEDAGAADPQFHAPLPRTFYVAYCAKVRRWDDVRSVTPGDLVLDDGVVIEFGGTDLIPGDYWVFTTRVVDRSVERLIEEPPRGIVHRFYRLATITRCTTAATVSTVIDDCRPTFNPLTALQAADVAFDSGRCAVKDSEWNGVSNVQEAIEFLCEHLDGGCLCTRTVGDGDVSHGDFQNIQAAIDALEGRGGLICILPGHHEVRKPIRIPDNVILRGVGPVTRIVFLGKDGPLFHVDGSQHVRFEDFSAVTRTGGSLIELTGAHHVLVRNCLLVNTRIPPLDDSATRPGMAVSLEDSRHVRIDQCRLIAAKGVFGRDTCQRIRLIGSWICSTHACLQFDTVSRLAVSQCVLQGIDQPHLKKLTGLDLSRGNLELSGLSTIFENGQLAMMGYFANTATSVTIQDTSIRAVIAVLPMLGTLHAVTGCDLFGAVNILISHGQFLSVDGSSMHGVVNIIQAGAVLGLEIRANRMLGVVGVFVASLSELFEHVFPVLETLVTTTNTVPREVMGGLSTELAVEFLDPHLKSLEAIRTVGVAGMIRITDNVLLSVLTGVHKTAATYTGDVTIGGNRIYGCTNCGIQLEQGNVDVPLFGNLPAPGHDVVDNHLSVQGTGVDTRVNQTTVSNNRISARREAGVVLRAAQCTADGNLIVLNDASAANVTDGIRIEAGSSQVAIRNNHIRDGSGSGIMFAGLVTDVVVELNQIERMDLNGITTSTSVISTQQVAVRGNRIAECLQTEQAPYPLWSAGGIVLAAGQQVVVTENVVWQNGTRRSDAVHGIYAEDLGQAEISNNHIWANGNLAGGAATNQGSGMSVKNARQDIRILGNKIQNNRGFGLRIVESSRTFLYKLDPGAVVLAVGAAPVEFVTEFSRTAFPLTAALGSIRNYFGGITIQISQFSTVSDNTIEGVQQQFLIDIRDVERLIFSDNRVRATAAPEGIQTRDPVSVSGTHIVFTGNHVEAAEGNSTAIILQGGDARRGVLTGNILKGANAQLPSSAAGTVQNAHNLFY